MNFISKTVPAYLEFESRCNETYRNEKKKKTDSSHHEILRRYEQTIFLKIFPLPRANKCCKLINDISQI